jgi:hypothetical protein
MRTLGIQFEEQQLWALKELQRTEHRSIGLMVREAVDDYIAKRKAEADLKRLATEQALAEMESMLTALPPEQRKKALDHVRSRFLQEQQGTSVDLNEHAPEEPTKAKEPK